MRGNTQRLETQRLILRRFTEEDIPAIYAIYSDKEVNTFLPMFPLKSMEQAGEFFEKDYAGVYRRETGCAYAVCMKEDGLPIGYVHCDMQAPYDFGYGLLKEHWGKGIISEASRTVVAWLKDSGQTYITATHDANNPRSGRVMQALGMKYKYSYKEQWMPKNILVTYRMYQMDLNGSHETYMGYWDKYPEHFVEEHSE